jgi:hypothetical protein
MESVRAPPAQGAVIGLLNYSLATAPRPAIRSEGPGRPEMLDGVATDPRWAVIRDGRRIADRLALDEEGFRLLHHPTSVRDFHCERQLKELYVRETEALVRAHAGARHVVVFDPTLRSSKSDAPASAAHRPPVLRVHSDFTDISAAQTLRDLKCEQRAGTRRFAILQVWRALGGSPDGYPLALADASSVRQSDLFRVQRVYPGWVGELCYVVHRPEHRWYWFPGMTPDEAVLFKVYDSLTGCAARWAVHTGFVPGKPRAAPAHRESIEIRALVFY